MKIQAAFFDIDGVLTDGAIYVDAKGREQKRIVFDDIDAVFKLKKNGIKIGFITGEDNEFVQYVDRRFTPDYLLSGCKDKLSALKDLLAKENLDANRTCYAGDSAKDEELLAFLKYSFAPADAPDEVRKVAKFFVSAKRGNGVIAEVAKFVLNS